MRKKVKANSQSLIFRAGDEGCRRSLEVPLLWLGVAAFVGYPVLRDATSDPMQRNRYGSDKYSCECDYGAGRCSLQDGNWLGPWYAVNAQDRKPDDPGSGLCREHDRGYGGHTYASTYSRNALTSQETYRGPRGIESGYRGGFGGTGRVRAAGS